MTKPLNAKEEEEKQEEKSVENFLYFIGISILVSIIPIFDDIVFNPLVGIILSLIMVFVTAFFVRMVVKYFKKKKWLTRIKVKLTPLYIIYSLSFIALHMLIEK